MIFIKDIITSRNNPQIKWAAALKEKKGRRESEAFIAEGEKLSYEALSSELSVTHVFVAKSKAERILPKLYELDSNGYGAESSVYLLEDNVFEKISTENSPQGIISVIKHLDFFRNLDIIYKVEFSQNADERTLFLSTMQSPTNLGAVIRSAVAFGVKHIVLSADSADIYNPKCVRAAMSSMFHVKLSYVADMRSTICEARKAGRCVYAAELSDNAVSLTDVDIKSNDIFVIGNEGHGISCDISAVCDASVYIPISSSTESLNASVAAAIFMWHTFKK